MIYKIDYDINLEKALKKVPKHDAKSIRNKIERLKTDPRPQGSIKLSGKEIYRVRIGDYRIIYAIIDDILLVLILDVDGRKDVYKKK
jgi:mRNA interferase RelE/StbE